MYVNSAIRMTQDGDWVTPKLMGRLFLFKAPLLQWLSALCIQLFGLGLVTVRMPALVFGAAAVAIVFAWTGLRRNWTAAGIAAVLLMSDPIWLTFSRLAFTDVLASTLALLSMYVLAVDPTLGRRFSPILFGFFAGAAVLAKSAVGVLPFAALALYWTVMPRSARPRLRQIAECLIAAAVIAAPWHLYQAWTHPQWFWAEFVKFQLLAVGITESTGVTGYPLFYLRRLATMDPVLLVASLIAIYGVIRAFRRRDPIEMAAVCWGVVVIAALAGFRGRSVSYMVLLIPALCVLAGLFLPRTMERRWILLLMVIGFCLKAAVGVYPWSLRYSSPPPESVASLREYYLQNRDTELVIAAPDDAFYAITLPGLRVRYCYVDPSNAVVSSLPHYLDLGIAVTAAQLSDLPKLMPVFTQRLSSWRLQSGEPVASAILLRSPTDMDSVVRALPRADFNFPAAWVAMVDNAAGSHELRRSGGRVFLLARGTSLRDRRELPVGW